MVYSLLADLLVVFHIVFILFVVLGGLFVFKWPRIGYLHIHAAVWGGLIEIQGWLCPLTPIENRLRQVAGTTSYKDSFIQHYLIPVIYPTELTREVQLFLGLSVLILNGIVYIWILLRVLEKRTVREITFFVAVHGFRVQRFTVAFLFKPDGIKDSL